MPCRPRWKRPWPSTKAICCPLVMTSGSARHDVQFTHHLVVFMREDVAVPGVASGLVEVSFDADALPRKHGDRVFGRAFVEPIRRLQGDGTPDRYIRYGSNRPVRAVVLRHLLRVRRIRSEERRVGKEGRA